MNELDILQESRRIDAEALLAADALKRSLIDVIDTNQTATWKQVIDALEHTIAMRNISNVCGSSETID